MKKNNEVSILTFPSGTYNGIQVCKNGVIRLSKVVKKKPKKRNFIKIQEINSNN